ncbi:sulfocyanin-like copper-binding protein [Streptomyces sp. NPDC056227]|uniref:sulfocyanin-like copper-binding protein n=1 Tax=unclassified Streptomyces TaxID=2593676 RepID=UPI0035D824D6
MNVDRRRGMWLAIAGAVAALVLGIGTTALLAATGAFRGAAPAAWRAPGARCSAPALPGHVVDVTAGDIGPGRVTGGPGWYRMRMMRLVPHPATVPTGVISLRVFNVGALTHEVVVLPLPPGQAAGERVTGPDGKVDEAGSLGESSRNCAAGTGDGIASGAMSWATLTLPPGRYELVCNFPGHYLAGMYAELDVTTPVAGFGDAGRHFQK